jgi:hypothetical protein
MSISYNSGIDYFTTDIDGTAPNFYCLVCETRLDRERSNGPRSWAGAMVGSQSEHWSYYCPNTKYKGHSHLVALYKEGKNFISKQLKELVFDELREARKDFLAGPMKEE